MKLWHEISDIDSVDVSVDASGSFVKRVKFTHDNFSSAIFLYIIVVRFSGKIYPIYQMLSDSHNTNTICDLMMRAKDDGAPVPKIIVVDCSLALLNAISLAYNDCSYNQYLQTCFKIIRGKCSTLPPCLIKRDRNHLIKNVTRWKCFKDNDWRVKDFYCRCVAYSFEIDNLQLLEEVLSSIFIVCQSESCDKGSECYSKKQWLMNKIETFNYEGPIEKPTQEVHKNNNSIEILETEDLKEMPKIIVDYLHEINTNCQLKCSINDKVDFPEPNFLECSNVVDNIILLYSQFPAWTNTLNSFYPSAKNVASSTGSECYFRILRREYNMNHPVSANRFILNHLKIIDGETKLGRATLKSIKKNTTKENASPIQVVQNGNANFENNQLEAKSDEKDQHIECAKGEIFHSEILDNNSPNLLRSRGIIVNGLKLPYII